MSRRSTREAAHLTGYTDPVYVVDAVTGAHYDAWCCRWCCAEFPQEHTAGCPWHLGYQAGQRAERQGRRRQQGAKERT